MHSDCQERLHGATGLWRIPGWAGAPRPSDRASPMKETHAVAGRRRAQMRQWPVQGIALLEMASARAGRGGPVLGSRTACARGDEHDRWSYTSQGQSQ